MEKLQHRRHRPVYLAPSAVHFRRFSGKSYDTDENSSNANDDGDKRIESLGIPLLVQIPDDDNLRFPITSPPCSNGSNGSALVPPVALPPLQHQLYKFSSTPQRQHEPSRPQHSLREKMYKVISSIYFVVSDFLMLVFVCVIGLFFHVEVQVVKQRTRRRRGRVVVQHSSIPMTQQQQRYQSTDLLQPQKAPSTTNSFLIPDEMV